MAINCLTGLSLICSKTTIKTNSNISKITSKVNKKRNQENDVPTPLSAADADLAVDAVAHSADGRLLDETRGLSSEV